MDAEGQKTILLVEDEAVTAMAEKLALEKYGYKIIAAQSGEQAVETVEKTPGIDLILMDINLGAGMDGTEAAAIILRQRDLPVVFLSSHTEPEVVAKTEKITSYGYVVKNSSTTVLDASIKMAFKLFAAKIKEKEKEAALRESEASYRVLFAGASDGILLADSQTKQFRFANPAICGMLGYTEEEFLRISVADIYPIESLDHVLSEFAAAARGEIKSSYDLPCLRKDGTIFYADISHSAMVLEGREYQAGFFHDITKRKQAEEDKEKIISLQRATIESTADGILVIDQSGKITDFNRRFTQMWGIPDSVMAARDDAQALRFVLEQLVEPQGFLAKVNELYAAPDQESFDLLQFKDGRCFERYSRPQRIAGQPAGRVWSFRDITERKLTEEALHTSEERLRDITFSMADWVWEVDENGVYTYSSKKGFDFFGPAREDLIGKTPFDFMPADEAKRVAAIFSKIVANKAPIKDLENWNIGKNGERICLLTNGVPILDEKGNLKGYRGVDKDISERKREEKLPEALYKISQAIYSTDNLNELFKHIHHALARIIPTDNLYIALLSDDGQALTFPYSIDEKDTGDSPFIEVDDAQSLTVEVLKTKRPLLLDETELLDRYATGRNKVWGTAPKCWLGVPLMIRETVIGVMAVQDYHKCGAYNRKDVALLESAAGQIAVAIDRKRAEENLARLNQQNELILRSAGEGILGVDLQGNHTFINPAAAKMLGYEADELLGRPSHSVWHHSKADGSPYPGEECVIYAAYHDGVVHRVSSEVFWRKDGTSFPIEYLSTPIYEQGRLAGAVLTFSDISERKRAEILERAVYEIAHAADESKSLADLYRAVHLIIEGLMPAANFLIALYDDQENLVSFPYFVDEIDPPPPSRKPAKGLTDYVLRTGHTLLCDAALEKELDRRGETKRIGSPSSCWLGVPLKAGDMTIGVIALDHYSDPKAYGEREKKILEYVSSQVANVIKRKQAEVEIKRQLAEKEILLKEVHHRIKNNIASIGGLISLRLQSITNPEAIAVLRDASGRVDSMRLLYDKLLLSEDYKDISVKNYLGDLIDTIVAIFPDKAKVRIEKRIADFNLDAKRLFPLGIIVNELFTNIMKYAFIDRDAGVIKISLAHADNHVTLAIQDNGNGLPAGFDINEAKGLGLTLVKMLSQQLGGSFTIKKHAGTRCVVEFNI